MKHKLARMKRHMGLNEENAESNVRPQIEQPFQAQIPYHDSWREFQATPYWYEEDYTLIREKKYPLDHRHGRHSFVELKDSVQEWQNYVHQHPLSSRGLRADDLLFFDTETTGLSRGTGNMIFLLGYSQMKEDHVVVKQFFLPGPESEVAFYHHFLSDVGNMHKLVTYNGKAFDWPQLKTRHTLVRDQVPKLPRFGHFDLLHGARRLWKHLLPSCKLSVVEKEILHFERVEDTPSYMVPMLYFDFLQESDPEFVRGIFQHHEWDVLSLMTLYTYISKVIMEAEKAKQDPSVTFEIAKWYESIGEDEIATQLFYRLMGTGDHIKEHSMFRFAIELKRKDQWQEALHYFETLRVQKELRIESAIESAKLYEHKIKDYEKAMYCTKEAIDELESLKKYTNKKREEIMSELEKRRLRLLQKNRGNN